MKKRLMLETLVFDDSLWPRVQLDNARVHHLADLLRAEQPLPPIKVQKDSLVVLGGRHTIAACREVGNPMYWVEFVDIAESERLLYAYREDVTAALPYTDGDVRSVARRLYAQRCTNGTEPNVSALARDLGRSQRSVAHWVEDLVTERETNLAIQRNARTIAVHAFHVTGLSTRRSATLVGISETQVRRDSQIAITAHLADSRAVMEAQSLIHLAIGKGATESEVKAASEWLIAQTDPDYLRQRQSRHEWSVLASELRSWADRIPKLTIPTETPQDETRHHVEVARDTITAFLAELNGRLA